MPLAALLIFAGTAAPLVVTALVVLVVMPLLATYGDVVAQRLRSEADIDSGWRDRVPGPVVAPARFVRNLVVSVVRASPVLGVAVVVVAGWYLIAQTDPPQSIEDGSLRLIGAATVAGVLATSREGSAKFRTGLAIDELVRQWVPEGRTTERLVVAWLVIAILVVASLWLTPDPFPLP